MSSAGVTYARGRVDRVAQARSAKAKRQKLLLAGGAVLLVALLAVQVPRTLRMLSPAEATVAEPPPVAVPSTAPPQVAPPTSVSPADAARVQAIQFKYTAKDPFTQRRVRGSASPVGVRSAPAGGRDPFAPRGGGLSNDLPATASLAGVRDPFTPRKVRAPGAVPPPAPEPIPLPDRPRGYTIVIASIPERNGQTAAVQVAAAARARGVLGVGVIRSSDYPTLRPGYFAVYSRLFETRSEAQRAIGHARSLGYPKAYVRPLGR